MYAAVVTSFDAPPACLEVPSPVPAGSDQVLVDVTSAWQDIDGTERIAGGRLALLP
jgi:hypothetical protein